MNMISEILEKFAPQLSKHGVKLSVEETPAVEPVKVEMMDDATLADGTMIYTNAGEMAEGVEVFVMDRDGNPSPLGDGEYTFDDGTKIIVSAGVITSYVESTTEEPMAPETPVAQAEAVESYSKEQVEGLLKNVIAEFEAKLSAAEAKIVELSQAPAAVTVKQARQTAPTQHVDMSRMTAQQRAYAMIIKLK